MKCSIHEHIGRFALSLYMTEYPRLTRSAIREIELALGKCRVCCEHLELLQRQYLADIDQYGLVEVSGTPADSHHSLLGVGAMAHRKDAAYQATPGIPQGQSRLATYAESSLAANGDEALRHPGYVDATLESILIEAMHGNRIASHRLACLFLQRMLHQIQQRIVRGETHEIWAKCLGRAIDQAINSFKPIDLDRPIRLVSRLEEIARQAVLEVDEKSVSCDLERQLVCATGISETATTRIRDASTDSWTCDDCEWGGTLVNCLMECLIGRSQTAREIYWVVSLKRRPSVPYEEVINLLADLRLRGWIRDWLVRMDHRKGAPRFRYFVLTPIGIDKARELGLKECLGCGESEATVVEKRWAWQNHFRDLENSIDVFYEDFDPALPV